MELFSRTMHKSATTALANAENPAFQEKSAKANAAMNGNAAAGEAVWDTLRQILENALGFLHISFAAHRSSTHCSWP